MEDILKKSLEEGEELLWCGKPEKFETLDKTYKPIFVKKLIISIAVAIALSVGYIILALNMNVGIKWVVVLIVCIFTALPPINIFRDAKQLSEKTLYAVSNRRFITVGGESAKTVEFKKIDKLAFCKDKDGHTNLICGPDSSDRDSTNQREAAVIGATMDPDGVTCERYVMYAVPNAEKLRKLLSGHFNFA